MCCCPTPTLHLNLALTGDGAFLFSLKKTHSVWFISVLNYGDTENVLINHLLLVIPMSYPCHYTNLCPHKPHKHAPTHTHTHTWQTNMLKYILLNVLSKHLLNVCTTHTATANTLIYFRFVVDACSELNLRQANCLSSIFYLKFRFDTQ